MKLRTPAICLLAATHTVAQTNPKPATSPGPATAPSRQAQSLTNQAAGTVAGTEEIRAACVKGRRSICGQVLQVLPDGLVVDSGYASLLRPPLTQSWVAPRTVSATRDPKAIEASEPGSICIGLIFLVDFPKSPVAGQYDYVIIQGYPAGEYLYTSVPGVTRRIRKFAAGLETAVRLNGAAASRTKESLPARP